MRPFHLNIPITKIDEEQRMAWGFATVEEIDAHGEIIGYEASKEAFSKWIGNIREMHDPTKAVGKKIEVQYDDVNRGVWLGVYISKSADGENSWIKVKEKILAGFSIGGRMDDYEMVKMVIDGEERDVLKITKYTLGEVSLVDSPACPSAILQVVKSVDGQLNQIEQLRKGNGRPIHWWEKMYKFADDQRRLVIKSDDIKYNKSSMKPKAFSKSIWNGEYLACLAAELGYYISSERYDNESQNMDALITAFKALKQAAVTEINTDDEWEPAVAEAMSMAMKTLDINKSDLEDLMKKDTKKYVHGETKRDAEGRVIDPVTGKPIEEVEETEEAEVEETEEEVEDDEKKEEEEAEDTEDKTEDADEGDESEPVEPEKTEDTENVEGDEDAEGEKSTKATNLKKTKAGALNIQKATLEAVQGLTKVVTNLTERVEKMEGKPMAPKGKASFVEKSVDSKEPMNEKQEELKKAFARADELAKSADVGSPTERAELAVKIRKLQRELDPASVAQINAIRASFPPQAAQ